MEYVINTELKVATYDWVQLGTVVHKLLTDQVCIGTVHNFA